jgi:hypothetical protein
MSLPFQTPGCASRPRAIGCQPSGLMSAFGRREDHPRSVRCGAPTDDSPRRQPWGPRRVKFRAPEGRQDSGADLAPGVSVAPAGAGSALRTGTQRSRAGLQSFGAPHLLLPRLELGETVASADGSPRRGSSGAGKTSLKPLRGRCPFLFKPGVRFATPYRLPTLRVDERLRKARRPPAVP